MVIEIILIVLGYLFGSIPVGYLIAKFGYKVDIQSVGSGNIGMANVMRTCGKKAGLATMGLDMLKGALPVLGARIYYWVVKEDYSGFGEIGSADLSDLGLLLALIALAGMIGHSFPVWLKFKGGKSAAVGAGAILSVNPLAFIFALLFWVLILKLTKMTSLSNLIVGALYSPIFWFFGGPHFFNNQSWWAGGVGLVAFVFLAWRHKDNIKRLIQGTERKIGQKVSTDVKNTE